MKTQDRIINVLEEYEELEAFTIAREIRLSYDTISKHLKEMTEKGILVREGRGDKEYFDGIKHWNYYYKLNNQ